MKQMASMCLGMAATLGLSASVMAEPVVPGFDVEVYAEMAGPTRLAFDPSGILYVGSAGNPARIFRVGVGGSPVEEYGDTPIHDPDAVAFDASGAISGTAGSVLVGSGSSGASGFISAILPDETIITVFPPGSAPMGNPNTLKFDQIGRLLIADYYFGDILVSTGTTPTTLFGTRTWALATDQANRIFAQNQLTGLQIIAPDGSTSTALSDFPEVISGVAFGTYDSVWDGDLIALSVDSGNLYRVDGSGQFEKIGSGFIGDNLNDVAFGPDGALYVSSLSEGLIYRITPADTLSVLIDIKPGSDKNAVNPKSKGKLPVAILTTDSFDASTVDVDTVRFGTGEAEPVWYRLDDVDYDGDLDLVLKLKTQETGITCGDTEAPLTGETYEGQTINGTDSITTVGCKANSKHNENHHEHKAHDKKHEKERHDGNGKNDKQK